MNASFPIYSFLRAFIFLILLPFILLFKGSCLKENTPAALCLLRILRPLCNYSMRWALLRPFYRGETSLKLRVTSVCRQDGGDCEIPENILLIALLSLICPELSKTLCSSPEQPPTSRSAPFHQAQVAEGLWFGLATSEALNSVLLKLLSLLSGFLSFLLLYFLSFFPSSLSLILPSFPFAISLLTTPEFSFSGGGRPFTFA